MGKFDNAVVKIFGSYITYNWMTPFRKGAIKGGSGTGFFISKSGLILTAAHVIEDAINIYIEIPEEGRKKYNVTLLGLAPQFDIALLKVKGYKPKQILALGDSDKVKIGMETMAYGYPLKQYNLIGTKGVVSGRHLSMIQMDTTINRGNSGGPLLHKGKVIGINVAAMVGIGIANTNYAVPINQFKMLRKRLEDTSNSKLVLQPFLGLNYHNSNKAALKLAESGCKQGVIVNKVFKGSGIEKTGIKEGDVLCAINGSKIDDHGLLDKEWLNSKYNILDYNSRLSLDQNLKIKFWDGKKMQTKTFKYIQYNLPIRHMYPLHEKPDYEVLGGIVFMDLTANHIPIFKDNLAGYLSLNKRGDPKVISSFIIPGSQVDILDVLRSGEVIEKINGKKIGTVKDLRREVLKPIVKNGDKFVEITNGLGEKVVLSLRDAVVQDIVMSESFRYPLTPFHQKLVKKIL